MNLVRTEGIGIDFGFLERKWHAEISLHAVHMDGSLRGKAVTQPADFLHRHDDAGFVAYLHHANQRGLRSQHAFQCSQVHRAAGKKRNFPRSHTIARLSLQAGIFHRLMLGGGIEHLTRMVHGGQTAPDGEVIALGAAGGEDYVFFLRAERGSNGTARIRQGMLGPHGGRIERGRVVERFRHALCNSLDGLRTGAGRRAVIQINLHAHS